ncbi:MAG: hypothetical protein LBN99_05885 [Oscillospiraceae bacterium]|jgi:hypothetical protein|nr:hypothetical protein [Oscillospiraceae bacterium]
MKRCRGRVSGGAILMCAGIILLGGVLLPAACWFFAIGLCMVLKGYSMLTKSGWRF